MCRPVLLKPSLSPRRDFFWHSFCCISWVYFGFGFGRRFSHLESRVEKLTIGICSNLVIINQAKKISFVTLSKCPIGSPGSAVVLT
ncbi:hypothetical protein L218DRAFT_466924 [Marasmius fiardii PR-910]|nr:hypothetical protein L218DRAFT_466924 [Marasmius fiardii PR-910]